MKIVSWNVDGLGRVLAELPAIVAELGTPEVLCLQEVRIRASDADAIEQLASALPGYACAVSLNADAKNATFRGGRTYGVATFVRKRLRATHRTFAWDREGRVLATELRGVTVFNVYAVNGTSKPYWDWSVGAHRGTRFDFKRAFQRVLATELRGARDRVVAIGDWNVSQTKLDVHPRLRTEEPHAVARAELAEIVAELDLVDAFRALHPDERAYTWFARGRHLDAARVDFALLSRALMPRLVAADVLPRRAESDHAPITIVLR